MERYYSGHCREGASVTLNTYGMASRRVVALRAAMATTGIEFIETKEADYPS